jgi:hypothetical protein
MIQDTLCHYHCKCCNFTTTFSMITILKFKPQKLFSNIRPEWNRTTITNTLAYCVVTLITLVKGFLAQSPWTTVIKLFLSVIYEFS